MAQVGPRVSTDHAESRLVSEYSAVVPGETATIALVQELEHHWHVYWQNPGDSGLPLDLRWTLPEGYEVSAPAYPLPHRLPLGPLVNYGHEGEPVFLLELTVPDAALPGTVATLTVEATWLICKDICVPETATLRLPLPIAADRGASTPFAEAIAAARAEQPTPSPFATRYFDEGEGPVLAIDDAPDGRSNSTRTARPSFSRRPMFVTPGMGQPSISALRQILPIAPRNLSDWRVF